MTKPILFNNNMVRAILDGRKTVTRRLIKGIPQGTHYVEWNEDGSFGFMYGGYSNGVFYDGWKDVKPPCSVGDILWVRETWAEDPDLPYGRYIYRADCSSRDLVITEKPSFKWSPSIHMPKDAARIFLRVTGVRVEMLQKRAVS